ncbi:MAG: TonB family protein [Betaproteobacteria bacterium]
MKRPLIQALSVSLVIHVVLLIGVVNLVPPVMEEPAEPLRVVIGRDDRSGAVKALAARVTTVKTQSSPVQTPVPVAVNAGLWKIPENVPAPSPAPGEAKRTPSTEVGVASAQPAGAGVGVAAVAREGLSADEMRYYRMSLATAARRFKRYPPLARERGWEGTAEVALNVSARVGVPEVVLVRSSGRTLLDDQAVEMISQAVRVTALPEGLKGRDFRILLPVQFSLENDQ